MRGARGLVLALAVVTAVGAAVLAGNAQRGQSTSPSAQQETTEVLVAARSIATGEMVGAADVRWQLWPRQALVPGSIRRSSSQAAIIDDPVPARFPILAGEPLVEAKLARPGGGVMASLVAAGMRAVSIPVREDTAAGGFIQPQDRVDVLLVRKSRDGAPAMGSAEVLFTGAKVLAIGRTLDGKSGAAAPFRTATLELTPGQAKKVTGAQTAGEISLALVGAALGGGGMAAADDASGGGDFEQTIRTMKFGRRSELVAH